VTKFEGAAVRTMFDPTHTGPIPAVTPKVGGAKIVNVKVAAIEVQGVVVFVTTIVKS